MVVSADFFNGVDGFSEPITATVEESAHERWSYYDVADTRVDRPIMNHYWNDGVVY